VAAAAFAPAAVLRSLLNLVLRLPLALLFAAAGAAAALLTVSGNLTRAAGYASGALVACYAIGPGSARARRPLSRLFGAITTTPPSAVVVFIGMLALAAGLLAAAFSLPPFVWPALHVSTHFSNLSWVRDITGLPQDFSRWRPSLSQVSRWLG
jgi:hypothetical protein